MTYSKSTVPMLAGIFISWVLPVLLLIEITIAPTYDSVLGFAFSVLVGLGLHIVIIIVWCIINRKSMNVAHLKIMFVSLLLMFLLMVFVIMFY